MYIGIIIISLVSVVSLFHSGLIPTHDGEYHVIRFYEFDKVLRSGVLYPRIAPDFNNGYSVPLFNFVYPLPNYMASFFHLFNLSFIDAFKANMILATIIGALGMYAWSKTYWGRLGGVVSAVVYTFAPYRLLDIFVRGSVGEVWALAIVPYVLYLITQIYRTQQKIYIPLVGVATSLLIFSHNILALLFSGFLVTYTLFWFITTKNKISLLFSILGFVFGIGLSTIFWLPALFEKQFVRGLEIFSVERHFVEIYQLLIPSWGSGFSGMTSGNGLSFQIGVVNLVILTISIYFIFKKKKSANWKFVLFSIFCIFLTVFLMLSFSKSVWQIIPLMNFFQFPWRLLSLVILLLGCLAGVVAEFKYSKGIAFVLLLLAILLTFDYTKPAYYHDRDDSYYVSQKNFIQGTNSPGDTFNTYWFEHKNKSFGAKISAENNVILNNISIQPQAYFFDFISTENSEIIVNTAYFPGWIVHVNDELVPLDRTDTGLMSIELPKGTGSVSILFTDTIVRRAATAVSLVSLLVIVLLFVKYTYYESSNR